MIDFDIEKIENAQVRTLAQDCADAGVDLAEIARVLEQYSTRAFPDANMAAIRAALGDLLKTAQSKPQGKP